MNLFNVVESNANQHEVYEILQQSLRRLLLEIKYFFYWFNLVIYVKELLIFFLCFINISACDPLSSFNNFSYSDQVTSKLFQSLRGWNNRSYIFHFWEALPRESTYLKSASN